jgi:sugar lactone lactonase YvrE
MSDTKILIDGLCFPEGPRWHDGQFWFSDMHDKRVLRSGLDGAAQLVVEVPQHPSGLGWLPMAAVDHVDERPPAAAARLGGSEVADLSHIAGSTDMVVDRRGRAYVGTGFDRVAGEAEQRAGARRSRQLGRGRDRPDLSEAP